MNGKIFLQPSTISCSIRGCSLFWTLLSQGLSHGHSLLSRLLRLFKPLPSNEVFSSIIIIIIKIYKYVSSELLWAFKKNQMLRMTGFCVGYLWRVFWSHARPKIDNLKYGCIFKISYIDEGRTPTQPLFKNCEKRWNKKNIIVGKIIIYLYVHSVVPLTTL
jgi:hypothetical protein